MKIDKQRPLHWFYLAAYAMQALVGLIIRTTLIRGDERLIVLYGHKLNGNLLALYDYLQMEKLRNYRPVFLTADRTYHRQLKSQGISSQWAGSPLGALLLARAVALVSDHGLHSLQPLQPLYRKLGLRFFDVWHGIPFKGFDANDFRLQQRYDETWVASGLHRDLYVERYGFDADKVIVTGYARTDRLVSPTETREQVCHRLGLSPQGRFILFAPTWAQDARGRSIYPFGHDEAAFLGALSSVASRCGATVLLRTHLNSGEGFGRGYENVRLLPGNTYPDTESILLVSDLLICDWSSIAFDYLLLGRPTLFLDVSPPFRKGFSLGPEYRFGAVIGALGELVENVEVAMQEPQQYWLKYRAHHDSIRTKVYEGRADGRALERCVAQLDCQLAHQA